MIPAFIQHGTLSMATEPERLSSRSREIDSISLAFQDPDGTLYRKGTRLASHPGMVIVERERVRSGPLFDYRLQLEGIEDGASYIETSFAESQPEEGWDVITRGIFTETPEDAKWMKGARYVDDGSGLVVPGFERLWVVDRESMRHRAIGYHEVGLLYKGLRYDKAVKRRINTTAQALSTSDFSPVILLDPYYTGPGSNPTSPGNTTYILGGNVEFDLPQISVTDTFISTSPPPTTLVPSSWIPNDAPPVTVVSITGGNDIYHYPAGWKVLNLASEQIPGQSLWLISLTWGYQRSNTPQA